MPSLRSVTAAATVAVGTFAQAALAHSDKHNAEFRDCFRWNNETNSFAGGGEWYNSDACNNWYRHAMGWEVCAAVVLFFAFLLFPMIFFCARFCCKCCGGRHPTRGCCCSDESTRDTFPGYSTRSIRWAKIYTFLVLAAMTTMSVFLYIHNSKLHTDVLATTESIGHGLDDLQAKIDSVVPVADSLAASSVGLASPDLSKAFSIMSQQFSSSKQHVTKTLGHVNRAESHPWWGRNTIAVLVPSSGLVVMAIGMLCALFSCRRLVGVLVLAMCIHGATMWLVTIPHRALHEATTYSCDNYEQTIAPIVVGAAQRYGACANAATLKLIDEVFTNAKTLASNPRSEFCLAFESICREADVCTKTFCGGKVPLTSVTTMTAFTAQLNTMITETVNTVSQRPSFEKVKADVARLSAFAATTIPSLDTVATFNTCNIVRAHLDGPIHGNLCDHAAKDRARNVNQTFMTLAWIGFHAVLCLIFGMKRFRKAGYNTVNAAAIDETAPLNRDPRTPIVAAQAFDERHDEVSGVVVKDVAYVNDYPSSAPTSARCAYGTTGEDAGAAYHRV